MTADLSAHLHRVPHATLPDIAALLRDQQARKVDVVAPASAIRSRGARLAVDESAPLLGEDGVTMTAGTYLPTEPCDGQVAEKLGISVAYLRKLRDQRPDLYDQNVNGWLADDGRSFMVRCLRPESGTGTGVARGFLSDSFKIMDHLDGLMACLEGIRASGYPVRVDQCDLTDRRMYLRVICEEVRTLAPALLAGYRSPFTGASGADNPVVFSGFVITNSETGFTDAVRHFLDPAYAEHAVREIERQAGRPVADPAETVRTVSQKLRFTEEQQAIILDHFIRGGDVTAGGVMHAITSTAQTLTDADAAWELEGAAVRALQLAAAA
jgi:hypothetical protein